MKNPCLMLVINNLILNNILSLRMKTSLSDHPVWRERERESKQYFIRSVPNK